MISSNLIRRPVKDWVKPVEANAHGEFHLPDETRDFYYNAIKLLLDKKAPFLLGGAYAFSNYTGVVRHTKDLDIFCRPSDCESILDLCEKAGYRVEITFRHWLGKIWSTSDDLIDVIYGSGNGICEVDEDWYRHSVEGDFLGMPVRLIPCEEMIWSKGYILERNRYDGADIAHLLRAQGSRIDWGRLLARFGEHWRVLYAHLVLFGFIYPDERDRIPVRVLEELTHRFQRESGVKPHPEHDRVCQGTLFSHSQYAKDLADWGYKDARLPPHGNMTPEDVRQWTEAFKGIKP